MDGEILKIEKITKCYKNRGKCITAVDNISLTVNKNEFVILEGPSGSGKTTILLCAGALLHPDSGKIILQGTDVYAAASKWRIQARATILGFVFQQFHLIPYLTVKENISIPSIIGESSCKQHRSSELIERFGLSERQNHYSDDLSTGERQRVALARALYNKPELILADEPTGNLDDGNAFIVLEYLKEYTMQGGAVLLVTHDSRASSYANRKYRIIDGKMQ